MHQYCSKERKKETYQYKYGGGSRWHLVEQAGVQGRPGVGSGVGGGSRTGRRPVASGPVGLNQLCEAACGVGASADGVWGHDSVEAARCYARRTAARGGAQWRRGGGRVLQ
jgi:hypothetical protein